MSYFLPIAAWSTFDTWIVVTAALAAMSCALPGNYLLLRRQSMMGDAISHTALLGIVLAFLLAHTLKTWGWISSENYFGWQHTVLFAGALVVGVSSALLTEWVQRLGRMESSASLGVVFTTMFAAGLLLIRIAADEVHIDPECVLYGNIESVMLDTYGTSGVPRAALTNGGVLLLNGLLVVVFFKELQISAFDPALATTLGINARFMHYALMAVTALSLVAAFESVGSILVIAMLVVPAATAHLLTDRLPRMIGLSLLVACLSALLGHGLAITLPSAVFGRLGFTNVVDASTAGMMAAASGVLFLLAMVFSPRQGIISQNVRRLTLQAKIAGEDVLGYLFRVEEQSEQQRQPATLHRLQQALGLDRWVLRFAVWQMFRQGRLSGDSGGYELTDTGRLDARRLVRAHRLWESYMSRHFEIPADHLHATAHWVEHYLDEDLRARISEELDQPQEDPHGKSIPEDASEPRV